MWDMAFFKRWMWMPLFVGGSAAVTGCYENTCEEVFRCPFPPDSGEGDPDGREPRPCPVDPADGRVEGHCGIWVAASWGNDENPGTQAAPVATIERAVALAGERTGRVYACSEVFTEVVRLPSGISLAGGFSCKGGEWDYPADGRKATIAPGLPSLAPLVLLEGTGRSTVTDLRVEAADAVEPGGSSIAVMALDGADAVLDRCTLMSGHGADGADGADGDHNGAPAFSGLSGNPGAHACTANPGLGGLAVKLECEGGMTSGGNGGNGGEAFANDGAPGLQPPDPNAEGYGTGGKAEDLALGSLCSAGAAGVQGNSGDHGAGATGWGKLTVEGYFGEPGADGVAGTPGQGGGGGGGSTGNVICGGMPHGGAGGGSGGTGGCGGRGGRGGQGGGSSIGIAALDARVDLYDVRFYLGDGGNGGNGGALQPGGQGGFPGLGGLGFGGALGVNAGCHGGAGGQGGNGGNGGGGRGGHSLGILTLFHGSVLPPTSPYYEYGNAGKGGKGGNDDVRGTEGDDGDSGDGRALL